MSNGGINILLVVGAVFSLASVGNLLGMWYAVGACGVGLLLTAHSAYRSKHRKR